MTTAFLVTALPACELDRLRARGHDAFGNPLIVTVNQDPSGTPLRCCLQEAAVGDAVALLAWQPSRTGGAYAEVGPVFVHAEPCAGYDATDAYPAGFRQRTQLFRSYDTRGRAIDNRIVDGGDAEPALAELFARGDVDVVHSRNPLAGCYMFAIRRLP